MADPAVPYSTIVVALAVSAVAGACCVLLPIARHKRKAKSRVDVDDIMTVRRTLQPVSLGPQMSRAGKPPSPTKDVGDAPNRQRSFARRKMSSAQKQRKGRRQRATEKNKREQPGAKARRMSVQSMPGPSTATIATKISFPDHLDGISAGTRTSSILRDGIAAPGSPLLHLERAQRRMSVPAGVLTEEEWLAKKLEPLEPRA